MTPGFSDSAKISLIEVMTHMAVIMGWYAGGAAVICLAMFDTPPSLVTIGVVFLATMSVYLIDRAGWRSGGQDPADRFGDPSRAAFMSRHGGLARRLAWIMLALAIALAAVAAWWLPLLVAAAPVALAVYLRGPLGGRLKDRLFVKNIAVGGAIIGFIIVVSVASTDPLPSWKTIGVVALAMFLQVVADCVLCDIDDAEGDRRSGTRTVANTWSPTATWGVSAALVVASSVVVAGSVIASLLPWTPSIVASSAMAASWLLLWIIRPCRLRHAVDARLGVSGAATWLVVGVL